MTILIKNFLRFPYILHVLCWYSSVESLKNGFVSFVVSLLSETSWSLLFLTHYTKSSHFTKIWIHIHKFDEKKNLASTMTMGVDLWLTDVPAVLTGSLSCSPSLPLSSVFTVLRLLLVLISPSFLFFWSHCLRTHFFALCCPDILNTKTLSWLAL